MTQQLSKRPSAQDELKALIKISKNNVNAINSINKHIREYTEKVDTVVGAVDVIKGEISVLKNNEEITTLQASELRQAVAKKVYSILKNEEVTIYGRKVFQDCWRYLQRYGCQRPYATTPKKYYADIIGGLKNYDPDLQVIKSEVDKQNKFLLDYRNILSRSGD